MMRLIDADALMESLGIKDNCGDCQYMKNTYFCEKSREFVKVCEAIIEAPTIEMERNRSARKEEEKMIVAAEITVNELKKQRILLDENFDRFFKKQEEIGNRTCFYSFNELFEGTMFENHVSECGLILLPD